MSVYIKGFPLPNNCGACPLRLAWCRERIYMVTRPERCPLVPVPPHGDLIDRDEYRDEFMNGVYALCSDDSDNYRANAIIDLFDAAPTIIPAEEGE